MELIKLTNINHLIEVLTKELSSQSIMDLISSISKFHRIQGSSGFLEAAEHILSILNINGLDCKLYEFPADGKWEAWRWSAPLSWDISFGEMWLIKPIRKRLCSFRDTPMSVITHSKPGDFEASVVDVGTGDQADDYAAATGKIALITAAPRRIFPLAAKHGVKGLILYPNPKRATELGPFAVQYDGFWPNNKNLPDVTSGFSISLNQALELKQLLKTKEEVRVSFKIAAEFYEGNLHVLETEITGSEKPEEEIILIAHLCHPAPGANDNTSGSATLVELVLGLKRMIDMEELSPPKRTLKFLWVPEFSGTIPWMKKYEEQLGDAGRKIICALNLDMVGESPSKIGTPLKIIFPSYSTPSYLGALVRNAAEKVAELKAEYDTNGRLYQLNFRCTAFAGGSDHIIFNDQHFSIPSVMFGHDDPFHHSSSDSLDKVDPLECRSVAVIAGSVAYGLATPDKSFLEDLALFVVKEAIEDATNIGLSQNDLSATHRVKLVELHENLALKKLESVLKLDLDGFNLESIKELKQMIKNHFSSTRKLVAVENTKPRKEEKLALGIIKRNYAGLTSFKLLRNPERDPDDQKRLEKIQAAHWGAIPLEFLNLANGSYYIEEIFLLLKAQYHEITPTDVTFMVELFQKEEIIIVNQE
ncbi:MAG: DUF4910 domain-containing protein [Candidatus Hermodarchaeota archaeon]